MSLRMRTFAYLTDRHLAVKSRDIYLIGICGTGMGALAGLLIQAGYNVCGSDSPCVPTHEYAFGGDGYSGA